MDLLYYNSLIQQRCQPTTNSTRREDKWNYIGRPSPPTPESPRGKQPLTPPDWPPTTFPNTSWSTKRKNRPRTSTSRRRKRLPPGPPPKKNRKNDPRSFQIVLCKNRNEAAIKSIIMKQNQCLFRTVPGEKPETKPQDFLNLKACCTCSQCQHIATPFNPEIVLDEELEQLRREATTQHNECDFVFFLNQLQGASKQLPRFRFLDTVVLREGEAAYAVHFQADKLKINYLVSTKNWVISRKESRDLKYQIKRHEREHNFHFTAFEHKCQKKIKEFENNIKYKTAGVLNRTAILKLRGNPQEVVISRNEFLNMFDLTKARLYNLKDIEYIQVFPVMTGEEQQSYVKTIKYFRSREYQKKAFKLAEMYVSVWRQRNDSIQKLEENVYEDIRIAEGLQEVTEELKLYYQSYKLFIYFEELTNIRVEQAVLHYITNDSGKSFFFKGLDSLKTEKRVSVEDIDIDLPAKKQIAVQDYIHLPSAMKSLFDGFQTQFQRLDKEREEIENKLRRDRQYSDQVYKTILSDRKGDFHQVLKSRNMRYKKTQLNL